MNLTIEYDPDDGQILAAYLKVSEGEVFRTVEISEGECYADEDSEGKLLGVEMLCADRLPMIFEEVANAYPVPGIREAFSHLKEAVAA